MTGGIRNEFYSGFVRSRDQGSAAFFFIKFHPTFQHTIAYIILILTIAVGTTKFSWCFYSLLVS